MPGRNERVTVTAVLRDLFSRPSDRIEQSADDLGDEVQTLRNRFEAATGASGRLERSLGTLDREARKVDRSLSRSIGRGVLSGFRILARRVRTAVTALRSLAGTATLVSGILVPLAGALALRGAVTGIRNAIREMDTLAKTARRTGIAVDQLSALAFAGELAGVELASLTTAVRTSQRNLVDFVRNGTGEAERGLEILGLTAADITGPGGGLLELNDLLPLLADRLAEIPNQAERVAAAQFIFGRGGFQILTLLQQGGQAVSDALAEAERLGAVISPREAEAAERLADSLTRIDGALRGLKARILAAVVDPLEAALDSIANRLASLPTIVTGTRAAITQALSTENTFDRAQARLALLSVIDQLVELLKTAGVGVGRVIGTALIEAATVGLIAITPTLERVFRDALGPVLNQIPGVDIALSPNSQLAQLREEVARIPEVESDLERVRGLIASIQDELSSGRVGQGSRRNSLNRQLVDLRVQLRDLEAEQGQFSDTRERIERDIALLERQVRNAEISQSEGLTRAIAGGLTATADAARQLGADLAVSSAGLNRSLQALQDYSETAETEAVPATNDLGQLFRTGTSLVEGFTNRLTQLPALVSEFAERARDGFVQLRLEQQALEARRLRAFGETDRAEDLERSVAQQREILALEQERGDAASVLLPLLLQVQQAETNRVGVNRAVAGLLGELGDAETRYREALEARAELLQSGEITGDQALQRSADALNEYNAAIDGVEERLNNIRTEFPEFAAVIEEALGRLSAARDAAADAANDRNVPAAPRSLFEQFRDLEAIGESATTTIGRGFLTLGSGIAQAALGVQSFGDAVLGTFRRVGEQLAELVVQFLLIQALNAAIPGFGSVFGLAGAAEGGQVGRVRKPAKLPGFHGGGKIGGTPPANPSMDNVVIAARSREWVIPEPATAYYGDRIMEAIRLRMIPREFLSGFSGRSVSRGRGGFNEGGEVRGDRAASATVRGSLRSTPTPALLVASDRVVRRLLAGGDRAFVRALRDAGVEFKTA